MRLPLDGLVIGVQVGATEAITVLQETWREGATMWALCPMPLPQGELAHCELKQARHIPGEGTPGGCQGGVWTRAMLRGKEPGPGERGPWGGQGGDGARAGCGGSVAAVPGSCLIIPFSIWALRVLEGDSECFLFLEGCAGSLGTTQRHAMGGWLVPEPLPFPRAVAPSPLHPISARYAQSRGRPSKKAPGLYLLSAPASLCKVIPCFCHSSLPPGSWNQEGRSHTWLVCVSLSGPAVGLVHRVPQ